MEIREVAKTLKDTLGEKGFIILVAGAGLFGLYNLIKDKETETIELQTPTGVASYPDAVTNANVIIDSVNQNTNYNTETILSGMTDLQQFIGGNFNSTNSFLEEGFANTNDMITDGFTTMGNQLGSIENSIDRGFSSMSSQLGALSESVAGLASGTSKPMQNIQTNNTPSYTVPSQPAKQSASYYSATPYKGVSIVDGLKAIGEYAGSSYDSRKAIAEANGISNYTGTAQQNSQLLNLLKAGKLKKA